MSGPDMSSPRAKNLALALLALTQFVVVIDASITNVALPSIGKALDISQDDLSWVVNSYTLVFGGFLLLGGRLADFFGRRRMFMVGMALFGAASLAGGFAQSEEWLIIARAIQGLGAAIASPAALSIVTTTFSEGSERNRALGIWGAVAGAGGAAGVLLGGTDRVGGGLGVTGLVNRQHHRPADLLRQVTGGPAGHGGQDLLGVPDRAGQQVLQPIRTAVTDRLGDGPAVLPRQLHQQTGDQVGERGPRLAAPEQAGHGSRQVLQQRAVIGMGYGRLDGRRVRVFRHSSS